MADFDIVREYDWTSVPRNSPLREEAPCAIVVAHQLDNNQLQQFIDGYLNTVQLDSMLAEGEDPGIAFYRGIYKGAEKLGTSFFPFFTDAYRAFSNEYADSFSPISQRGAKMIGAENIENLAGAGEKIVGGGVELGKGLLSVGGGLVENIGNLASAGFEAIKGGGIGDLLTKEKFAAGLTSMKDTMGGAKTFGAPGSYIETPKFYQYGNTDQGVEFQFVLSNTLNDDAPAKNAEFIKEWTTINRPTRLGPLGMTFPAIYHVEIPGLRYIEWASLDNFNVSLLGQRRKINGVITPEAYVVSMSFTSLTVEAANFMKMVQTPSQSGGEYQRERAQALGELRQQANPTSTTSTTTTVTTTTPTTTRITTTTVTGGESTLVTNPLPPSY
tara:strand:+ start:1235 stop:2389 length:1155 start_codon:yes stop_codon:yes gene_type:complete